MRNLNSGCMFYGVTGCILGRDRVHSRERHGTFCRVRVHLRIQGAFKGDRMHPKETSCILRR